MSFPASGHITDNARTEGEVKSDLDDWLAATKELPGGQAETELTISGGSVTPTRFAHSIDTEGDAGTDFLDNATLLDEGRLVVFHAEDAARVPTIRHAQGGSGQFLLADDANLALDATDIYVCFRVVGTNYVEQWRSYGAQLDDFRAFLGITTVGDSLATAASKAAARTALDLDPGEEAVTTLGLEGLHANPLWNGGMDIDQENEGAAVSDPSDAYVLDGWVADVDDGNGTWQRKAFTEAEVADVDGQPRHYLEFDVTSGATNPVVLASSRQIPDVRRYAGRQVTISFDAEFDSSGEDVDVEVLQHFGTGGTPSADVVTAAASAVSVGTTWARYSATITVPTISAKTIGSDGNDYLAVQLKGPSGSTYTGRVTLVKIEPGAQATQFVPIPEADALWAAQVYYAKTFPLGTAPAQSAGVAGAAVAGANSNSGYCVIDIRWPRRMRASPSVTTYNPSAANANARNLDDSTDTSVSTETSSELGVALSMGDGNDTNDAMAIHATADARL